MVKNKTFDKIFTPYKKSSVINFIFGFMKGNNNLFDLYVLPSSSFTSVFKVKFEIGKLKENIYVNNMFYTYSFLL